MKLQVWHSKLIQCMTSDSTILSFFRSLQLTICRLVPLVADSLLPPAERHLVMILARRTLTVTPRRSRCGRQPRNRKNKSTQYTELTEFPESRKDIDENVCTTLHNRKERLLEHRAALKKGIRRVGPHLYGLSVPTQNRATSVPTQTHMSLCTLSSLLQLR
jgi:hypothetical protein